MYISWRHRFRGVCGGIDVVVVYHEYFAGEMDFAGVYHELLTHIECSNKPNLYIFRETSSRDTYENLRPIM